MKTSIIKRNSNNSKFNFNKFSKKIFKKRDIIGVLIIGLIIWQVLSLFYSPMILPGPVLTLKSLAKVIKSDEFFMQIFVTIKRFFIGMLSSFLVGSIVGILMGINEKLKNLLEPLIYLLQSIPPILFMTLAMIWFGLDGQATIFIVFIASVPVLAINVKEGFENIDPKLIEMANIFNFSKFEMIINVILPSLKTYFKAGLIVMTGLGWKLVMMGEVLSSGTGLGAKITDARFNLETDKVFAWGIVIIILCFLSQKLVDLLFEFKNVESKYVVENKQN